MKKSEEISKSAGKYFQSLDFTSGVVKPEIGEGSTEEEPPKKETAKRKTTAPKEKPAAVKETQVASIEIVSDKRRTSGFYIYPEYEDFIERVRYLRRFRTKGQSLEMILNSYLKTLSKKEFDDLMSMEIPKE